MNTFCKILFIGFIGQLGFAQNFDKVKLDNYFNALEINNKFMGSVAVAKNGVLIYSKAIGFSDLENAIKANVNTTYKIGSISKTFTAVLVLKAVEENKLKLHQTLDYYFPEVKNAEKITVEQLLTHRSGIHNFTDDFAYLFYNTQPKTEKEMLEIITNAGSDFEPDSKAAYSNSNYVLLTYILEKSYETTYGELLQKHITEPLALKDTHFGWNDGLEKSQTKSYSYLEIWKPETVTDVSIPLGAGGIVSTPSDLVKFSAALFNGKLLKKESLDFMKTIKEGYGMGLFTIPFYDKTGYGHTGGIDGFTSVFSYFPEDAVSYALTSNGTNFNNNEISIAVLSAILDKPYELPNFSTYQVNEKDLDSYSGLYASTQIPLKITITKEGNSLTAQATGQSAFPLEATAQHQFKFQQAGIVLEFNPEEQTMILKQGGGEFLFKKE
ncbi:MAG TPA: serine hydrolase domain-containing protein [Flavobacterium sp.]|nr:serine hydrolase domain-containing protein [Flavobacterium sp.]